MQFGQWLRPPRLVLTLFFLLISVCAIALGWLGWQLLEQDRVAEIQRQREQLESLSTGVVGAILLAFDSGAAEVRISETAVTVSPEDALAYVPQTGDQATQSADSFDVAESLEFKGKRPEAIASYRQLARSADSQIRAGALVRMARAMRLEGSYDSALQTYGQLEHLGEVQVAGMPAALIARGGRCSIYAEMGAKQELLREAESLWTALTSGRFRTDRQTLETYLSDLRKWVAQPQLPADWEERMAVSEALATIREEPTATAGRRFLEVSRMPVSIVWDTSGETWRARVGGATYWKRKLTEAERMFRVRLRVATSDGRLLHGPETLPASAVVPSVATGRLPLQIAILPTTVGSTSLASRRPLIVSGLAIFAVLLAGGTILIGRAMNREIALIRLQADFVSAVSHEFRTPLTGIRQLAEMLAKERLKEPSQVRKSYELILAESDRLGRLVDSILDFGRVRSGMYQFHFEPTDVADWARRAVEEFRAARGTSDLALTFVGDSHAQVALDREALRGALWNLLDNAVKYSPEKKSVLVEVSEYPGRVTIAVEDRGMGISAADLRRVFDRFYRGESAKEAGMKGTGIGLALVREIVEAHGGTISAQSEPGKGSRFTIQMPCEVSQ